MRQVPPFCVLCGNRVLLLPLLMMMTTVMWTAATLTEQLVQHVQVQELKPEFVAKDVVVDVKVACGPDDMAVTLHTSSPAFSGLVYPKGLSKNSSCMVEYKQVSGLKVAYSLPLRSCNTMSVDVPGGIEYFNTIVVQPHRKLVTNQGKGFHIRCRYNTEEKTLLSNLNVSALTSTPFTETAAMPSATMRIYAGEPVEGEVAQSVKIGDPLTLVLSIDQQDIYGMAISDCLVRDGLAWSQQHLINSHGCAVDREIMTDLEYSATKTTAMVRFQAHKFPHTSSVYYQCNIRLCIRHAGGCETVPPICDPSTGVNLLKRRRRRRRQLVEQDENRGLLFDTDREDLKVKVYSGLYVNDASDLDDHLVDQADGEIPSTKVYDPDTICIPQRDFAIGIAIAGLILVLAVIAIILILLTRRRRRKDLSTTGSSLYSGPYTNTAYSSHSS